MGFFEGIAENIGGAVFDALRSLCYWLDTFIYNLIIYLYNWFLMLCNGRLLDNSVVLNITNRFSLILGIFMFFCVSISFLRMILDPDKVSDKEVGMGSIVKKVLLVVIMLGLSTFIFDSAYDLQRVLLGNNQSGTNVIQNLLSPYAVPSGDFGKALSVNLFSAFYDVDSTFDASNDQTVLDCRTYLSVLKNSIVTSQNFDFGYSCLNTKVETNVENSGGLTTLKYVMRYEHVLSILVGVFVIVMLFSYCISVGVRMVQLAFLEILSPMAIISYLAPTKDTMFNKWGKIYISTYIDVFIRVAIINFVVYLIAIVMEGWQESSGAFWESVNDSEEITKIYLGVIMIMALLTFAKRAPELLKQILPQGSGSGIGFGLSTPSKAFGDMLGAGFISGGIAKSAGFLGGAVGGVIGGAVGGGFGGAVTGLFRGAAGGLKNKKIGDIAKGLSGSYSGSRDAALRTQQRIAEGGSRFVMPGVARRKAQYDQQLSEYDTNIGYFETAEKEAEAKALRNADNYVSYNGNSLALLDKLRNDQTLTAIQRNAYESEYNATLKAAKEFNLNYGIDVKNGEVWFNNSGGIDELSIGGTDYSTTTDISRHISDLGDSNVVINANMDALLGSSDGVPSGNRFTKADTKSKANKTAKTNLTINNKDYQRVQADSKYSDRKN